MFIITLDFSSYRVISGMLYVLWDSTLRRFPKQLVILKAQLSELKEQVSTEEHQDKFNLELKNTSLWGVFFLVFFRKK